MPRIHAFIVAFLAIILAAPALSQQDQLPPDTARAFYLHKQFFLRSLCGDDELRFDPDGQLKEACKKQVPFTLDEVRIMRIDVLGGKLEISGKRMGVYLPPAVADAADADDRQLLSVSLKQPVTITVDGRLVQNQTLADFLPALQTIFAATYTDLAPNGPPFAEAYAASPHPEPDPAVARALAGVRPDQNGNSGPVLLSSTQPEFTEAARRAHITGSVLVKLVVSSEGVPTDVHVMRGLGYGLDETAIACVQKYRFKPAMKEYKLVPAPISVEVAFRIY